MRRGKSGGFTFIEMLVVVVVFALLAMIVLPSYRDSVRKSGRAAAKGALMDVAMRQEQFFLNNRSYSSSLSALGLPDPFFVNKSSDNVTATNAGRVYRITLNNTSATAFDAVATAIADQAGDVCGNYTLTSTGDRQVSGSAGADVCW
jgi:type IV pilus assembly protein PilE